MDKKTKKLYIEAGKMSLTQPTSRAEYSKNIWKAFRLGKKVANIKAAGEREVIEIMHEHGLK